MSKAEKKKAKKDPQEPVKPARVMELADKDLERAQGGLVNTFVSFDNPPGEPDQQHDFIQYIQYIPR